jgi:peptide/nickel transport system permease protein
MSATTVEPTPTNPAPIESRRKIAWRRRKLSSQRFLKAYSKQRAGVAGAVMLLAVILIAVFAPVIYPKAMLDPNQTLQNPAMAPPSWHFWLGTEELGRSVIAVLAWGARSSLVVGLVASLITMVLGTLIGIGSGHYRGFFGKSLERLTDWFLVIPFIPLVIVLAAVIGQKGLVPIIIILGVTSWPGTARLVRAQTLSVSARPYMERAKVLGDSDWKQMWRHVLPNVFPLVLANTTLTVAIVILSQTTLEFLGLGDPYSDSWGRMLENALTTGAATSGYWWYLLPPGLAVIYVVLAFTLIGRALEVVLDPRLGSE